MKNTKNSTDNAASPKFPDQVTGMYILAQSLKRLGLDTIFGLAGIPVTEAAYAMQYVGLKFYSFRFEQQAGMAAQTYGYLTHKPGVLLTVSSLGFMNGLTATANATVNCYPMIQISGSSDPAMCDMGMGMYEELDQLNTARPLVKLALRCSRARDIPGALARAYRAAVSGVPGGVYIDMTTPALGEIMDASEAEKLFYSPIDLYSPVAPNCEAVARAAQTILSARRPSILIGKGAAYCRVEDELRKLSETYKIPYLPMSMAKGVLPDNGDLCAMSCRSDIMQNSDVCIIVGARLNWMLSFGKGKWNQTIKFVQIDVNSEEIDRNVPIAAPVVGDIKMSLRALLAEMKGKTMNSDPDWVKSIRDETAVKKAKFSARLNKEEPLVPMTHFGALSVIKRLFDANPDIVLINEGANTLDNTRNAIDMKYPRHRVDCATWAIMGMGMGAAVGAAVATGKKVVAIEGDSAFGFSGMDFSTVCRYHLPVTVIVFNNGGIYNHVGVNPSGDKEMPAPTTLNFDRYDLLGEAFGAKGYNVENAAELETAMIEAFASGAPALVNVMLAPDSGKESGHIGYLNPAPLINYMV